MDRRSLLLSCLLLAGATALLACGGRSALFSLGDGRTSDGPRPDRRYAEARPTPPGWIAIPAGSFVMGSPTSEPCREQGQVKESQHTVTLSRGFEMAETEVTQDEYQRETSHSPSKFVSCGPSCPVEQVSWHQAAAYCSLLSTGRGLPSCYNCGGAGEDTTCSVAPAYEGSKIYACEGYRLPTEAEWEYAYRAGSTSAFWNGPVTSCETDPLASAIGWYASNSGGTTHPVRQKQPNSWGLHDLPGNVWEWCHDGYQQDLGGLPTTDPVSSLSSSSRAIRGSSYMDKAGNLRAADRFGMPPAIRNINVGLRCVRSTGS